MRISAVNHFGKAYGVIDDTSSCVTFTSNCDGAYNVLIIGTRCDRDAKFGWNGVEQNKAANPNRTGGN